MEFVYKHTGSRARVKVPMIGLSKDRDVRVVVARIGLRRVSMISVKDRTQG